VTRIDVDFNERDRNDHVIARVPADILARLSVGHQVNLYDPIDRLWGEGTVASVDVKTRSASFEVDWNSFVNGDLAVEDGAAGSFYVISFRGPRGMVIITRSSTHSTGVQAVTYQTRRTVRTLSRLTPDHSGTRLSSAPVVTVRRGDS
jgi:hypothetical protein